MIELVLVIFLLGVALVATVAVKVGLKAIDFMEATCKFQERMERYQQEIATLLGGKHGGG